MCNLESIVNGGRTRWQLATPMKEHPGTIEKKSAFSRETTSDRYGYCCDQDGLLKAGFMESKESEKRNSKISGSKVTPRRALIIATNMPEKDPAMCRPATKPSLTTPHDATENRSSSTTSAAAESRASRSTHRSNTRSQVINEPRLRFEEILKRTHPSGTML
jgi:hypothetical protein